MGCKSPPPLPVWRDSVRVARHSRDVEMGVQFPPPAPIQTGRLIFKERRIRSRLLPLFPVLHLAPLSKLSLHRFPCPPSWKSSCMPCLWLLAWFSCGGVSARSHVLSWRLSSAVESPSNPGKRTALAVLFLTLCLLFSAGTHARANTVKPLQKECRADQKRRGSKTAVLLNLKKGVMQK